MNDVADQPMSAAGSLVGGGSASAFRDVPYMGVIFVVAEAMKLGFRNGHPDWSNLGQGQPEVGEMEGAPPRIQSVDLQPDDHAYGPVNGTDDLRQTIADHYNRLYRDGKASKYRKENVSVASGGRLALSRIFAALGTVGAGYQVPDYTAYEDLFDYHRHRLMPVLLTAREEDGFVIPAAKLEGAIRQNGLGAFLISNPCNPTGQVVQGDELRRYVDCGRRFDCAMIFDEFYSHFIYTDDGKPAKGPVSAAAWVEDVNAEPILIVDGLTKSFRYPGWRLGWTVGPEEVIDRIGRAASAIDGGPSTVVQRAALRVLEPKAADQATTALRNVFCHKRNTVIERLSAMGLRVPSKPNGTFYVWASTEELKTPFRDPEHFFRAALDNKVLTVPGVFFDVNPGKARKGPSPLSNWMRFSFGPPEDNMEMGLDRLARMLQ